MAVEPLTEQFRQAQATINLGRRVAVAQAAHLEVREILNADSQLADLGLTDVLIGSYARNTGIWPGKDVDVFAKLTRCDVTSITPDAAYNAVRDALIDHYQGRLEEQPRSLKISFGPQTHPAQRLLEAQQVSTGDVFEFCVDVVPAVVWGQHWAIPTRDRTQWPRDQAEERWVRTDPEQITTLTSTRNQEPTVDGQGAFVPTVKAIKQIRRHHLQENKPGGLFYEFILHEGFESGTIVGTSWADITAAALRHIAERLRPADHTPVCDPGLGIAYQPAPTTEQLITAHSAFAELARRADEALAADRCPAAAAWRYVFGTNGNGANPAVFPLPAGCREDGSTYMVPPVPNPLRGSDEARGFGGR